MRRATLLALLALLAGCTAPVGEDLDPARSLAGEVWLDDGPPIEEGPVIEDASDWTATTSRDGVAIEALTSAAFELPFPCGQVWAGQTRTAHSPSLAVDFNRANDIGDTVVASAAGVVTRVENLGSRSYGRWIEIDHGSGFTTRYAHLSAQSVHVGQHVARGQRIGAVGDTGGSTGPHLHFELRRFGTVVRPVFHGHTAFFWGTRNYTSQNACSTSTTSPTTSTTSVTGRVSTAGAPLNVRSAASASASIVGTVADGATVHIRCQRLGTTVTGTYGTSAIWDSIGTGYVADAYVSTGSDGWVAPRCQ